MTTIPSHCLAAGMHSHAVPAYWESKGVTQKAWTHAMLGLEAPFATQKLQWPLGRYLPTTTRFPPSKPVERTTEQNNRQLVHLLHLVAEQLWDLDKTGTMSITLLEVCWAREIVVHAKEVVHLENYCMILDKLLTSTTASVTTSSSLAPSSSTSTSSFSSSNSTPLTLSKILMRRLLQVQAGLLPNPLSSQEVAVAFSPSLTLPCTRTQPHSTATDPTRTDRGGLCTCCLSNVLLADKLDHTYNQGPGGGGDSATGAHTVSTPALTSLSSPSGASLSQRSSSAASSPPLPSTAPSSHSSSSSSSSSYRTRATSNRRKSLRLHASSLTSSSARASASATTSSTDQLPIIPCKDFHTIRVHPPPSSSSSMSPSSTSSCSYSSQSRHQATLPVNIDWKHEQSMLIQLYKIVGLQETLAEPMAYWDEGQHTRFSSSWASVLLINFFLEDLQGLKKQRIELDQGKMRFAYPKP